MFNDLMMATFRQPRPASPARLRAMARQIARPHEDYPEAADNVCDMVQATLYLTNEDRETLRWMLRLELGRDAVEPDGR